MEFGLSEEQTLLQDSVNRFLEDQAPLDTVRQIAAGDKQDAEVWQGLTDLGVPGLMISENNGGLGLTTMDAAVVAECLGYHVAPSPYLSSALIAPVALQAAGKHEDLLSAVATGERRIGIAFAEGFGARGDAGIAVSKGKLSGKSLFALDAAADDYLVATQDREIYLVSAKADGLNRQALTTVDKTRTTCELVYKNVAAELVAADEDVFFAALN
ncbi:MAG: acyl-CoA dehydrogenase family protein, partial [Pseudomonadales bacterium]